jgi:hypothetical protein
MIAVMISHGNLMYTIMKPIAQAKAIGASNPVSSLLLNNFFITFPSETHVNQSLNRLLAIRL